MNDYARKELEKAHLFDSQGDFYGGLIGNSVMELFDTLDRQGHSGCSYRMTLYIFERLANDLPLSPLTGKDYEWTKYYDGRYQNVRCGCVFKDGKHSKAYNEMAKLFTNDGGKTWYTDASSKEYITFPYTVPDDPKRFYLNNKRGIDGN